MKNLILNKNKFAFVSVLIITTLSFGANISLATSNPVLTLTNNTSTVGISVTGADPNAVVNFYFPNTTSNSSNPSYTSIDLGQTDANGSYSVQVAPNSYGLSGGSSVYVGVDGTNSPTKVWPIGSNTTGQSGSLSLLQNSVTLTTGLTATIMAMNTSNTLTVQSNSNTSVASAYLQQNNNSVIISAMNIGSTTVSICASNFGCSSVNVSVVAPSQTITFSLPQAYVIMGNSPQSINIYGPGSSYSISNTDQNGLSANVSGSSITLQGLSLGQATITVCAPGWNCGTLPVSIVNSGSSIPYQASTPAPISSDLSQAPQLTSFSITSNNVYNSFFSKSSTLNINFGTNQTLKNVQVKIAGSIVSAGQGSDGKYYAQYQLTGNESLPIPVSISFTNLGGISSQFYFTMNNSATASSDTSSSNQVQVSLTNSSYSFSRYLYMGMTASGVSDPDVVALQQRLTSDGVYSGPITGYFGPLTKAGLQAFQNKNGLDPVGVLGPQTRALLNAGR